MSFCIDFDDVEICMLTHNEEKLIGFTLSELASRFSRFTIVDQDSDDNTVNIIRDLLGNRVNVVVDTANYIREIGFAGARNQVSDLCTCPWIMHVDADEQAVFAPGSQQIEVEQGAPDAAFVNVIRLNLQKPTSVEWPVDPEQLSNLVIESEEKHVRLYRRDAGLRWHSFIHEELWHGKERLPHQGPLCNISLNHLSRFKGQENIENKEEFYGWMIMKGFNRTVSEEDRLSNYSMDVLEKNWDYFAERAEAYARKHGL